MGVNFFVGVMMVVVERVVVTVLVVVDVNVAVCVQVVEQVVAHFQRAIAQHGDGVSNQYNGVCLDHRAKVGKRFGYKRKEAAGWQPLFVMGKGTC